MTPRPESAFLPVDPDPTSDLLVDERGGSPVWPASGIAEYRLLGELAQQFGCELVETRGIAGSLAPRGGEVVALGRGVQSEATLYAHLTQRSMRVCEDLSLLAAAPLPDVVVVQMEDLRSELFDILYRPAGSDVAPGIIVAAQPESLRVRALLSAAAARLCGPTNYDRLTISEHEAFDVRLGASHKRIGGEADAPTIRAALREGAGLLSLLSHGDGTDLPLTPEILVCPMDRAAPAGADVEREPLCVMTGDCYRHKTTVKQALDSGKLISPDVLTARILLVPTCFGLPQPDDIVDPLWGLAPRLIDNPRLGALITSWTLFTQHRPTISVLEADLLAGVPAGRALASFNGLDFSRAYASWLVLVGDPRVRLPGTRVPSPPTQATHASIDPDPQVLGELTVLRACMEKVIAEGGRTREPAIHVREAILDYESAAWLGLSVEGAADRAGPRLRAQLATYFHLRGEWRVATDWLGFSSPPRTRSIDDRCPSCARRTYSILTELRVPHSRPRRWINCARCGIVSDSPADVDLHLEVNESHTLELVGELPCEPVTIGVRMSSPDNRRRRTLAWPETAPGRPARRYRLTCQLASGPIHLGVIVLWATSFAVLTWVGRGPTTDAGGASAAR